MTSSESHLFGAPPLGKPVFEKAGGVLGPLYSVEAGLRQHLSAVWYGAVQNWQVTTGRAELSRDCVTGAASELRVFWTAGQFLLMWPSSPQL